MEQSPGSSQGASQTQETTSGTHHISCTNCRKRKIKCNRVEPCGPCQRSGVECIFRARAPRSQNKSKDPKSREAELLLRLSRLEGLVSKIDPAAIREARGESAEYSPPNQSIGFYESPPPVTEVHKNGFTSGQVDGEFSSFVKKQQHWSRHVSSDFWHHLTGEIDGLRQILEEPMDEREDEDEDLNDLKPLKHIPPYFLFGESDPHNLDNEVPYASCAHQAILFRFYFKNIDPIVKILHRPTAEKFLTHSKELIDPSTHRYKFISLEAVTFAMFYVTVASLSPEECMENFHENREALLVRYRLGTEVALLRGDFLNSTNVVFLHAFVIYIIGLRASRNSQSCWTFIGLAIRIAFSLGIHRDGDGSHLNAHEAEVRRRIWWHLFALDMRASEDRGCEPTLSETCFNTRLPLNIEDEDFAKTSPHPILERSGITLTTYSLISMEMARAVQKLHFNPPNETGQVLNIEERENLAKECISRIDKYFTEGYDPGNPRHQALYMQSRMIILRLWLVVQYPMQSMDISPSIRPKSRCLRIVVDLLSMADALECNEFASRFNWHLDTSVSWHPFAVALAELCTETEGPLADEAWRVIDKYWARWSLRVASSREEKMWTPVRRLLKKAREARRKKLGIENVEINSDVQLGNQQDRIQGLSIHDSPNGTGNTSLNITEPSNYNTSYAAPFVPNDVPLDIPNQIHAPEIENGGMHGNGAQTYPPIWNVQSNNLPSVVSHMNYDDWNAFIYDAGNMDVCDVEYFPGGTPPDYMGEDIECII